MKAYAAYYNNKIRMDSSSGGIFSLLAFQFDVVYGVAMTEDCYGCEFVQMKGDIAPIRGSKYFQAKVGDAFKKVKTDILSEKSVLFSGTGCQINGLKHFLGKEYENLMCVDVICHGVPSPKLWREYVAYQESKYGKLANVNFRCKDDSWTDFGMKENQLYISKDKDTFMRMFLRNYCLRPACYECHAKYYKKSDITIGDFWGIENVAPEMNDGMGISLIITRTEKGQILFDKIKTELEWKEVYYEDGVKNNPAEYTSAIHPKERETFFDDLSSISFEEMERKYATDRKAFFPKRVFRKLKNLKKEFFNSFLGGGNEGKQRNNADYGVLFTFYKEEKR